MGDTDKTGPRHMLTICGGQVSIVWYYKLSSDAMRTLRIVND